MDAQGALDSLLGRLSAILVGEARLLGGLHGDVEFINDEMESMNGLLHHLTEAHHRDHQVRAWMKQVVGLARDCEGNVELYIHSVAGAGHHASGLVGYLRHMVRYVHTIPERHRIATRILELKVKARDVLDRQQRYGVTVPPAADQDDAIFMEDVHKPEGPEAEEEDVRRRALLVNCPEDYVEKIIGDAKSRLSWEEPVGELEDGESQASQRIFIMTWDKYQGDEIRQVDQDFTNLVARKMYERSSFSCKALVKVDTYADMKDPEVPLLREILHQVAPGPAEQEYMLMVEAEKSAETPSGDDVKSEATLTPPKKEMNEATRLTRKLQGCLRGKRFLIIFQNVCHRSTPGGSREGRITRSVRKIARAHGSPASAVVMTTDDADLLVKDFHDRRPIYKIFKPQSLFGAFYSKTMQLAISSEASVSMIAGVLALCHPDVFAMKMFQHLLYVNHGMGKTQIENFIETLSACRRSNKSVGKQMLRFAYSELPTKYRSCLLYLTIFPQGHQIRRTTVCRRWITEGLITSREKRAEDEADCCFDALLSRGLIQPGEIGATGKTKTCTLHPIVREVMTRIARDINFVDIDLPPSMARHLPVHSRTGVLAADGNGIVAIIPYLAKSSQWQLMKMLDLEGCRGLQKHHLKSICKIILLKYLSLRNTDVTELPKQIEKLQCLETLDIRKTEVQAFATRSIMLPMLKRLLAGQAESPGNSSDGSQDLLTAVRLPSGIRRMAQLETLSHVDASHSVNDLTDVGHLLRLRKLGVILSGEKGGLGVLFQQIEKLHGSLRSLSIQINQPPKVKDTLTLASPPKLLHSLNISGIRSGLLTWIAELDQLTKITLSETYLAEDYIRILGKLAALCCLRLRRNSYAGSGLTFKEEEFSLKSLGVDDDIITNITFDTGAAPKLETIVWSSATMEAISGVGSLPKLKKLEFNGYCNPELVKQVFEELPDSVDFEHKPRLGHQEDGATVATSTSMSK